MSDARAHKLDEIVTLLDSRGEAGAGPVRSLENRTGPTDEGVDRGDGLAVVELLRAAGKNDLRALRRSIAQGVPVQAQDYDQQTALHLAAAEGQQDAVRYLIAHGHLCPCVIDGPPPASTKR